MSNKIPTSNDLIDGLVRQFFAVEPDVMASLAHDDEQVRLRRLPDTEATTDPLDGLEVVVRRVVAMTLRMRRHPGAVALVTEPQARRAGWPTATLANAAILLAWGLYIETEPCGAMPVLLAADETAEDVSPLIRVGRNLPPLPRLLEELRRGWHVDAAARDRGARARENAPARTGRALAPLADVVADWLGVDVGTVELLADRPGRRVADRNARAAFYVSCIPIETLEMGQVLAEEQVMAVRLKTEHDARLAGLPGAVLCNLVLLLGAAFHHGGGATVHVLPPDDGVAAALGEAGRRIASRNGCSSHDEAVDGLELEDLARRGYVHVGRRAAHRVAWRLHDRCTRPADRAATPSADEAAR